MTRLDQHPRLNRYVIDWASKIEGYGSADVLGVMLPILNSFQLAKSIEGHIGEIGVHHGRLFLAMDALRRDGERSIAVDVFGDQALNIDGSGAGNRAIFEQHVASVSHDPEGIMIFEGDSLSTQFHAWMRDNGLRFRIFSVDGGHTAQHAINDLKVAETYLAQGGAVLLDDFFNPAFPGVTEGLYRYLDNRPPLVPVCTVSSKLILSSISFAAPLREHIRSSFAKSGRRARPTNISGHDSLWLVPKA